VGFRVFKLDETNMTDVFFAPQEYSQLMLAGMERNIKEDRTDMDLLFGCALDWALPLSLPHTREAAHGCTVHTYNGGDLVACFDANVPETAVRLMASRRPLRAVFRDSSFEDSPKKINVFEIFKLLSPGTEVRVI
jgi:adenine-specific DNA-methyltransferase